VLWAHAGGGHRWSHGCYLASDAAGNAYLSADFQGIVKVGPHALISEGDCDFFVAKYSPAGQELWARKGYAGGAGPGNALAVDRWGNVYKTGSFNGTARFGQLLLSPVSSPNAYVAKLTAPDNLRFETAANCLVVSNGMFSLEVAGCPQPGSVVLDVSTNLVNWSAIATNSALAAPVRFCVPAPRDPTARFFRARLVE
jgi:hypothetical protein